MSLFCVICRDLLFQREGGVLEQNKISKNKSSHGNSEFIVTTKCGHLFHHKCITTWISKCPTLTQKCPCCNQRVYTWELVRLYPAVVEGIEDNHCVNSSSTQKAFVNNSLCTDEKQAFQEILQSLQFILNNWEEGDSTGKDQLMKALKLQVDSLRCQNISKCLAEDESSIDGSLSSINEKPKGDNTQRNDNNDEDVLARTKTKKNIIGKSYASTTTVGHEDSYSAKNNAISSKKNARRLKDIPPVTEADDFERSPSISNEAIWDLDNEEECEDIPRYQSTQLNRTTSAQQNQYQFFGTNSQRGRNFEGASEFRAGDKVAWNYLGELHYGKVKWKGFIGSYLYAGIQFKKPFLPSEQMGENSKKYLFKAKHGHGALIPLNQLEHITSPSSSYSRPCFFNSKCVALFSRYKVFNRFFKTSSTKRSLC